MGINLFEESGYIDIPKVLNFGATFNWLWGGRGTGKTYGALKYLLENRIPFVYLRRTVSELDSTLTNPDLSPLVPINQDLDAEFGMKRTSKYTAGIFDYTNEEAPRQVGIALALSTIANIRGFDGSAFQYLLYDEFIPEPHVRLLKDEAGAFLNAYETINRNRELKGSPPLRVLGLANANLFDNPLFMGLELVTKAHELVTKHKPFSHLRERDTLLVNIERSPISAQKAKTALYRMSKGTAYNSMALDNQFASEQDTHRINPQPLREYKPIAHIGEISVYRHKDRYVYYATAHSSGAANTYGLSDAELMRFRRDFYHLRDAYISDRIFFDARITEILLTRYLAL